MEYLENPWRGRGLPHSNELVPGTVCDAPELVMKLLGLCPAYLPSPLRPVPALATQLGLADVYVKDERQRMGLGSFKALGAAFAIAKQAYGGVGEALQNPEVARNALAGVSFVTASAGNHGLSVAAGARIFGAKAVIFLAQTVPQGFAELLHSFDAEVIVSGENYEASVAAASEYAARTGGFLLSDSTGPDCLSGQDVMEGYLALCVELAAQFDKPPTHIFLQAGVGGLAASVAVYARKIWGDSVRIIVVEPRFAPALIDSIRAGRFVSAQGPVSDMGRLDCKEASHLALRALAEHADGFMTLSDAFVLDAIGKLPEHGLATSSSGGAGIAGLMAACTDGIAGLNADSRVLTILSEGPTDEDG